MPGMRGEVVCGAFCVFWLVLSGGGGGDGVEFGLGVVADLGPVLWLVGVGVVLAFVFELVLGGVVGVHFCWWCVFWLDLSVIGW